MARLDDRLKWSLVAGGTAALAGLLARRGLERAWEWWVEEEPPANPADSTVSWGQALAWAGASASVAALARLLARRGAAEAWRSVSGGKPPF